MVLCPASSSEERPPDAHGDHGRDYGQDDEGHHGAIPDEMSRTTMGTKIHDPMTIT